MNGPRFQIVIFSNQSKISLKKGKDGDMPALSNFKKKLTALMTQLDLPMSVYASTEATEYRKPRPGMWAEFVDDYDLDVVGVDMSNSVYVGDAAGRPGDFAATDQ
jgi:bifunctional polynucleotide phosphatase/kinase